MRAREGVITPELFGHGLCSAEGMAVLRAWKEGQLRPVVCWSLLKRYLAVLRKLGVTDAQTLRAWVWTWSDRETVTWVEDPEQEPSSGLALCHALAAARGCALVVWKAFEQEGREGTLCVSAMDLPHWLAAGS